MIRVPKNTRNSSFEMKVQLSVFETQRNTVFETINCDHFYYEKKIYPNYLCVGVTDSVNLVLL